MCSPSFSHLPFRFPILGSAFALLLTVFVFGDLAVGQDDTKSQAAVRDYNAAAALQNSGFYNRAAERWATFLKKYPKDARLERVHYYLGVCQLNLKKYPESVATFRAVLTKYPKFASLDGVQYNLAMAQYQLAGVSKKPEEYKVAAASFGEVTTKYPKSKLLDKALYFQSESLFSSGDLAAAVTTYQKLIQSQPKSGLLADAYYGLAATLQDLGQDEEAVKSLQAFLGNAALAANSLAPEMRLRLGISLFKTKKFAEADKEFGVTAALPNFALADFALLRQAQCRLEVDKPAEAIALLTQMMTKYPKSTYLAAAQLACGKCYYETEKWDDAAKMLTPVTAAKSVETPEAKYWLGRTLLKKQQPQEALKLLEPAVAENPEGEFAPFLAMARVDAIYELPDRKKETPALYDAFAKKYPAHALTPQAVYMAALSSLGLEDYQTARTHAEAFLAKPEFAEHVLQPEVVYIAGEGYLFATKEAGGDLAKAEALFRGLIQKSPQHPRAARAHLRIGWCLYKNEKSDETVAYLNANLAKLALPEEKAEAQLLIGRSHSGASRDKEAVAAFNAALAAKPDWARNDEVLVAAAQSQRAIDDQAGAVARLKELLAKHPRSELLAQATFLLADIAQQQGKPDESIPHFQAIVQNFATSEFVAPALYGLGSAYFTKEDFTSALKHLDELIGKHAATDAGKQGYYLRGLSHQRLKQFDPATKDLTVFLAGKPAAAEGLDARYALALCRIGLKQAEPAVADLRKLLQDKPDYVHADKAYYELGHALLELKKDGEAAVAFRTLGEKFAASSLVPEAFFYVGQFHEQQAGSAKDDAAKATQLTQAEAAFSAGLAKAQDELVKEKLRYKLGDMQFQRGEFAAATATLMTQLKDHPTGELAGPGRFLTAESLYRQDKFAEALPLFAQVADEKIEKFVAQSLYRAGACATNLKNWPESQRRYTQLLTQFPKFEQKSEARYGVGLAQQNQGQLPQARQTYEMVTTETESETAAKARFMIGELSFGEKKYEDAIEHFLLVAVGYPYKSWQALARFEAARCFIELGDKAKAKQSLEIVVAQHKDHPKAKDAAALIKQLDQQ
ncbi:MAG: tetratricopeptide repeat protein [Pirellulaceae bacterium]|jgi:TolA-binding protein|nr:tetratricopeptide repeat protein [Pirellulaceae bacterium]MDP7019142.1 tetratricopeptide repeat protein [Pirellulaceae bacterium]